MKMWEWAELGVGGRGRNHYMSNLGQESLLQITTKLNSALHGRKGQENRGSEI